MIAAAQLWLAGFVTVLAGLAMAYMVAACVAVRIWRTRCASGVPAAQPATILIPLCGAQPELYESLRTFCVQSCSDLQIICGARDPHDPALDSVRRLQHEFPRLDLRIEANPAQHGSSAKVSNLINMVSLARHDYLVIADADARVPVDYLERVVAPLADEGVGIVTCLYRGRSRPGPWSLLGSLFINEWFMPSARVAAALGSRSFAFGATIALRRAALQRIGGFAALADQLPDDYRLGELTRRIGLRTVLSEVEVEIQVDEASLGGVVRHELRWLRTIRTVRPLGYALAGVTFGLPVTILASVLAAGSATTLVMMAITALARFMISSPPRRRHSPIAQLWLVAFNDLFIFALWCWSFTTRHVQWRQTRYRVARDGTAQPIT